MNLGSKAKLLFLSGTVISASTGFAGTMGMDTGSDIAQGAFYVRGDIAYNVFNNPSATTAGLPPAYTKINAANPSVSNQAGYNIGLGYRFMPQVRGDLTLTYRPSIKYKLTNNRPETASGKLKNYTFMVNGYYDIPTSWIINPYLMVGLGLSSNETSSIYWPIANLTESANKIRHFAWQLGLGGYYPLSQNFFVDLNYQFVDLGTFSNSGLYSNGTYSKAPSNFSALYSNQFQAGVRYQFG